jgi:hypothetical protein
MGKDFTTKGTGVMMGMVLRVKVRKIIEHRKIVLILNN